MPEELNTHTENVFVYGTLRKGEYNHHVMENAKGIFLSDAKIHGKVHPTSAGFPCLCEGAGMASGEVYSVPREGLRGLDLLEGHPHFYERRRVTTESGLEAWAYFGTGVQRYVIQEQ